MQHVFFKVKIEFLNISLIEVTWLVTQQATQQTVTYPAKKSVTFSDYVIQSA
jgi:hypothetical protein